jgi:hypothetical protein
MQGENEMIVCDKCKRIGIEALPVTMGLGRMRNMHTPKAKTESEIHISPVGDSKTDLCKDCISELASQIKAVVLKFRG